MSNSLYEVTSLDPIGLAEYVLARQSPLIGWLSFDDRSISVFKVLSNKGVPAFVYLTFGEGKRRSHKNRRELLDLNINHADISFVEVSRSDQMNGAFSFQLAIQNLVEKYDKICVDVSAFPREYVCMLAAIIHRNSMHGRVSLIYNLAKDYSYKELEPNDKWLSRGIGPVQLVWGFSGKTYPGRPTVMIALVGLDDHRIVELSEVVDPQIFVLGKPTTVDENRSWIGEKIEKALEKIRWRFEDVRQFSFDCDSILSTKAKILELASDFSEDFNIILAPNNNKISTFACALAALENTRLQIVFAPAIVYNVAGYSMPSNNFNVVTI